MIEKNTATLDPLRRWRRRSVYSHNPTAPQAPGGDQRVHLGHWIYHAMGPARREAKIIPSALRHMCTGGYRLFPNDPG